MRRRWARIAGVLRKVYYRNALEVVPAIDRSLFPAP